ncbi:sigma factor [Chitinophaga sancti]|uniref:DNA-directed RNA polymerase specialized sigma subunit, sigma24 family n=1 Tax=Chitinophaga sancti TaxID=1004 RepID=A0A1K1RM10_9BACT|nr:sigma factor [Chitinophaga sancti]WQD62638.1 sigma factor [Chitinophaga sancti]WQG91739.1 sigma factor [Chitinophaga sancti]SFW73307.1 DNA-directed RNA polymerase specialized sigma subunit, sigma24 family [Chitinophaga sancti]
MQYMDDSAMLAALKGGDLKAYQYFFMKYYKPLCLKARTMLTVMEEAEQLVQHVFVQVWEEQLYLEIDHSMGGYLYKMVHNSCVNLVRKSNSNDRFSADPGLLMVQHVEFPLPAPYNQVEMNGALSLSLPEKDGGDPFRRMMENGVLYAKQLCREVLRTLRLRK